MDLLASNVTNLRAAYDSSRVSVAQSNATTSVYTSHAHTFIANMIATPSTPHMDLSSSSSARPSASRRDPHLSNVYHP